jgi:hypothetical protein
LTSIYHIDTGAAKQIAVEAKVKGKSTVSRIIKDERKRSSGRLAASANCFIINLVLAGTGP